jgi:hypothetical protein
MEGSGVRLPVDNQVEEQILEYFDWALLETGGRKTKDETLFSLWFICRRVGSFAAREVSSRIYVLKNEGTGPSIRLEMLRRIKIDKYQNSLLLSLTTNTSSPKQHSLL